MQYMGGKSRIAPALAKIISANGGGEKPSLVCFVGAVQSKVKLKVFLV